MMKKTEKQADGSERETHIDDFPGFERLVGADGEFHGEAPPDRSGPVNDEVMGTMGAMMPKPSALPQEEGHPPEIVD